MSPRKNMDLLIHIGQVSGAYMSLNPKEVWRINPDGTVRDTFRKLRYVFQMTEEEFFSRYVIYGGGVHNSTGYYSDWHNDYNYVRGILPELPFSNAWIAQNTINSLPENSILHLGILNSLRSWNFFELPDKNISAYCNTGGFGIDGCLSSLVGASLVSPEKLCFGVIGDLAFYYDINALGSRHIGKNIRLIVINNGRGQEFRIYEGLSGGTFGEDADPFIAASGHFAGQDREFLKHYAEDLGFEYLSASSKEEYLANLGRFTTPEILDKSIFFEVFTDTKDESDALSAINNIDAAGILPVSVRAKKAAKRIIGAKNIRAVKRLLRR